MSLSFKTAAEKILRSSSAPLSAQEITELALEEGLINPDGMTPAATMAAQLYVDIKKNPKTPFKKVGKGKFAMKGNEESASSSQLIVEKQNQLVRAELRKQLHAMDPYQFEMLMGDLLQKLGYENVEVTKQSGDKGIDIVADLTLKGITDVKTVVQVKRYKESNKISGATVTQLRGSAAVDQRGLIITLSDFTAAAIEEAKAPYKMPVSLINGEKLLDLLLEYEVGVTKQMLPLYSIDSEWLNAYQTTDADDTPSPQNQKRGLWPLPGGLDQYVATLHLVLGAVEQGFDTRDKLSKWFMDHFESVNSESSALGYAGVPRVLGLMQTIQGKLVLTTDGKEFLASKDIGKLYKVIAQNVFGIAEMVEFINSQDEPTSPGQLLDFFNENLASDWKSIHQVTFRLQWLICLQKIKKTDDGYVSISTVGATLNKGRS